ncbi:hypothetical protein DFH08DRAFT_633301, partial [Mycena albidolilacea]
IHNTFRVGDFWSHIKNSEIKGICHTCSVPESLEHIALECGAPGQKLIWLFTQQLWTLKYDRWPDLNWGLIPGSNLVKFKSPQEQIIHVKGRLFAVLVSSAWHLIWNLNVNHVIANPDRILTSTEIYNQWLNTINCALQWDRLLTDKVRFDSLALNKQLMLSTWSGLLLDEDSQPDDWTKEGVL